MDNKLQELTLEHQRLINSFWKPLRLKYDLCFAEYSFTNAFLYRRQNSYEILEGNPPFVRGKFPEGYPYLIPSVAPDELLPLLKNTPPHHCIFPIPDDWVDPFRDSGKKMSFTLSDSDYLFHKSKLQTLKGRDLSSRRNLLHQLTHSHQLDVKPLTEGERADAWNVTELWQSHSSLSKEQTDYYSCKDALEFMEPLELFGRIAYADGEVIGYTIGELLTPKTALLHVVKANHAYKGAVPFLNQDFAQNLPDSVEWINMEQDLGIPSLRQAKKAYDPDRLVTKWRICDPGCY